MHKIVSKGKSVIFDKERCTIYNKNGDMIANCVQKKKQTKNDIEVKQENPNEMDLTIVGYIKLCAPTILPFEGDPVKLEPFINSIQLLEPLATTNEFRQTLVKFIKNKLSEKALDCLPSTATTVNLIIAALREKIKPESSRVLESRLAALRADRNSLHNFSKIAKELADNLKRSLVMDLARAVIVSTKFNDPREVVSAFIVKIGQEVEKKTQ